MQERSGSGVAEPDSKRVLSLAAGPSDSEVAQQYRCQQVHVDRRGKEQNAIRIARVGTMSARVPQAPDWKVVPGQATAIPAAAPPVGGSAEEEGRCSQPVDGVESSGPERRSALGPLDASPEEEVCAP